MTYPNKVIIGTQQATKIYVPELDSNFCNTNQSTASNSSTRDRTLSNKLLM